MRDRACPKLTFTNTFLHDNFTFFIQHINFHKMLCSTASSDAQKQQTFSNALEYWKPKKQHPYFIFFLIDSYPTESDFQPEAYDKERNQTVAFDVSAVLPRQTNLHVEQVEDDHYLFRRGSTEVHIQWEQCSVYSQLLC